MHQTDESISMCSLLFEFEPILDFREISVCSAADVLYVS